jgi:hypothetical protein
MAVVWLHYHDRTDERTFGMSVQKNLHFSCMYNLLSLAVRLNISRNMDSRHASCATAKIVTTRT